MKKTEALKRVIALHIDFVSVLLQLALYAYVWFTVYYPVLHEPRYNQQGFYIGEGDLTGRVGSSGLVVIGSLELEGCTREGLVEVLDNGLKGSLDRSVL